MTANEELIKTSARDIELVEFAYQVGSRTPEKKAKAYDHIPKGLDLVMITDFVGDTKEHEYRCAVFVDHANQEIIFANAGTRTHIIEDLQADLTLGIGRVPEKCRSSAVANDMILGSLGNLVDKYQLHYTGHSLGGAMADLGASDMAVKLRKRKRQITSGKISTLTFDNPGTKGIAERAYMRDGIDANACEDDINFNVFNTTPNLINVVNEQMGSVHRIIPANEKESHVILNALASVMQFVSKALEILAYPATYLLGKAAEGRGGLAAVASAARAVLLAPSKLAHVISLGWLPNQVASHKTENFVDTLKKGNGQVIVKGPDGKSQKFSAVKVKGITKDIKTYADLEEDGHSAITRSHAPEVAEVRSQELLGRDTGSVEIYSNTMNVDISKLKSVTSSKAIQVMPVIVEEAEEEELEATTTISTPKTTSRSTPTKKDAKAADGKKQVEEYLKEHPSASRKKARKVVHTRRVKKADNPLAKGKKSGSYAERVEDSAEHATERERGS